MNDLTNKIITLINSDISKLIDGRIQEFKEIDKKSNDELFKELCFCILTANFDAEKSIKIQKEIGECFLTDSKDVLDAEKSIKIQKEIGECFLTDSKDVLAQKLRDCGHRFPNARATYISESIKCKDSLGEIVQIQDGNALREWIVENVKGLGYKEASHFLRNVGFDDYAIIDFHVVDLLVDYKMIEKPKTITKRKYMAIENLLKKLARKTNLTLAELDLYLWYMETGKILK